VSHGNVSLPQKTPCLAGATQCLTTCPPTPSPILQTAGLPLWDETHGFEGWWLGSYISQKGEDQREGVRNV